MPPYKTNIDYKIKLISENTISYAPLYCITTEELLVVKKYLLKNLDKGFIALSYSLFASLVLFVKKANS